MNRDFATTSQGTYIQSSREPTVLREAALLELRPPPFSLEKYL